MNIRKLIILSTFFILLACATTPSLEARTHVSFGANFFNAPARVYAPSRSVVVRESYYAEPCCCHYYAPAPVVRREYVVVERCRPAPVWSGFGFSFCN